MKKMKKMKTLSLLFLAVIISSTGLTSCIEENVDPAVMAIYNNQALLLASQATLLEAEANYENASANAENALAAQITANIVIAQNHSAADINDQEEVLRMAIADNDLAVEIAKIALESAQLAWQSNMVALQSAIAEAKIVLADDLLEKYQDAMTAAQLLLGDQFDAITAVGEQSLLTHLGSGVSYATYLAAQEALLPGMMADVAAGQMIVDELAAVLADPTSSANRRTDLAALKTANDEIVAANLVAIGELGLTMSPLSAELIALEGLDDDYTGLLIDIDTKQGQIDTKKGEISADSLDIVAHELALTTIDADILAAQGIVDDAQAAKDITADALTDADEAVEAQKEVVYGADLITAGDNLGLEGLWLAQETAVNDAANALVDATNATDGGAQVALDNAILAQVDTDAEWTLAKSLFDADPAGSTYVEGEHNGLDGVLGDHSTTTNGAFATSHRLITTVDDESPNPVVVTWADEVLVGDDTGLVISDESGAGGTFETLTTDDDGTYFDVEEDDVAPATNQDRHDAASAAKLTADALVDTTQATVDNIDLAGDIDAAQEAYDAQVVIFETGEDTLDAAVGVLDGLIVDATTASDADTTAGGVLTDANTAFGALTTRVALEVLLAASNHELITESVHLDEFIIELDVLTAALAETQEGLETDYAGATAELRLAINVIQAEIDAIEDESDALGAMNTAYEVVRALITLDVDAIIALWETAKGNVVTAQDIVEVQQILISNAELDLADIEAVIGATNDHIEGLQGQIDSLHAIAAEYFALMEAALQS
jgi:hypothetical protein